MRRAIFVLPVVLIALICSHTVYSDQQRGVRVKYVSPAGTEVTGDNWLFVIGINDYVKWPRLKTAVNDAKAVKDVLLSRYCFDANHTIELYDQKATRANIIENLRWLARNVKKDDSLFIYYAGHGHLDSITKEGSWVPVESDTGNASVWISNHDIKNYLKVDAIKARHILLVSDSCFSGDFFRGHRGDLPEITSAMIKKAWEFTSRQVISSGGLEPVTDAGFGNNSVFSYFFVKTLRENRKPFLVSSDLFSDVRSGVAENAEQFPQFGFLKDTGGQQGGEFVFFLKQDTRLKDLSQEQDAKTAELDQLKKMEEDAKRAMTQEQAEIAEREKKLAALDAKITAMKQRMGTSTQTSDDSLDNLLAMAEQKDTQQKRLEELKQQKAKEEAERIAEIERLKKEKQDKRIAAVRADIQKYKKIVSLKVDDAMKKAAWDSLVKKYPEAEGVKYGDLAAFEFKAAGGVVNSLGMQFVYIKPGTFMMGSPVGESGRNDDETQHQVWLTKGFYMQTTEVTQGQWYDVMGTKPWAGNEYVKDGRNYPAVYVSWNDAWKFISKLSQMTGQAYRLPTEAEWEYACRAGSTTRFYFGDSDGGLGDYEWWDNNTWDIGEKYAHEVGQKKPNAWGLYDMHGNVEELCQDRADYKEGVITDTYRDGITDPLCTKGSHRVLRGGNWFNSGILCLLANDCANWAYNVQCCRSAQRSCYEPDNRNDSIGFRLVLSTDR